MRKQMVKILIGIAAAVVLLTGGKLMYRHFVTEKILDGPGMINKDAPMLELLNAEWMSEDGVWRARIDDFTLNLSYQQDLVYSGNFFFDFDGNDLNVKTELQLYDKQFEREDGGISSTIESLYVANCRMYLDIIVSKEGENSMKQQAVLDRVECGKLGLAEIEPEKTQEVSETAELVELFWYQSAMNYDDCFLFRIKSIGQDRSDPRLSCSYMDQETLERIEVGDGYDIEACQPISLERWVELSDFLRSTELPAYCDPDPGLLDATDSCISVKWREGDESFTTEYNGIHANDLLKLLQDIAREVYISD